MLDAPELKIVLSTLNQRRAWLLKTLEANSVEQKQRDEFVVTLKALDGSMQKLARLNSANKPKTSTTLPPPPAPKSQKRAIEASAASVLIAEDDALSAELLRGALEDIGITKIEIVADGRAALYALQNCAPAYNIVLCDWEMPEMNGLEVRRAVKSLEKLRDTYYVMVTGVTEIARIREAIALGVDDYIAKPVDVNTLSKKICAALAGDEVTPEGAAKDSKQPPPAEEQSA